MKNFVRCYVCGKKINDDKIHRGEEEGTGAITCSDKCRDELIQEMIAEYNENSHNFI